MSSTVAKIPGKSASELAEDFEKYRKRVEQSYQRVFKRKLTIIDGEFRISAPTKASRK